MSDESRRADPPERMCPSTPRENATVFLGMITPAGRVAYVTPAVPAQVVLDDQADAADQDKPAGPVEARYRLAGPCVTTSCGFWTGDHCGLGARLSASYQETVTQQETGLPRCAIRRSCRWFAEQGPAACGPCSHVITDAR
ncbi:hypothetical protein GCM10027280_54000 [Micromonospora polyrhachis]|uniref:Uncharacterized protein n=1 Tax=Micromonospora polyrhachis TaxID=1282883 RepID=A0A7W7SZT8_9ACTN|nr:hypothetical protein [Micromonospora polyrhachis]MBB4962640.1 hypothetical protein [Micromonospora polyrhachis]